MSTSPRPPTKASRSQFIEKLHSTLSKGSLDLYWMENGRDFAVSGDDTKARIALAAGSFDFRSLSSFVRQLSYYGFKRLSDRRRSSGKRPASESHIVFTHPTGYFTRDDPSTCDLIVRKLRARKEGGTGARRSSGGVRRASTSSNEPDTQEGAMSPNGGEEYDGPDHYHHHHQQQQDQLHHPTPIHHFKPSFIQLPSSEGNNSAHLWAARESPYPSPAHNNYSFSHHNPLYYPSSVANYSMAPSYLAQSNAGTISPTSTTFNLYRPTGMVGAPPSPTNSHSDSEDSRSHAHYEQEHSSHHHDLSRSSSTPAFAPPAQSGSLLYFPPPTGPADDNTPVGHHEASLSSSSSSAKGPTYSLAGQSYSVYAPTSLV